MVVYVYVGSGDSSEERYLNLNFFVQIFHLPLEIYAQR